MSRSKKRKSRRKGGASRRPPARPNPGRQKSRSARVPTPVSAPATAETKNGGNKMLAALAFFILIFIAVGWYAGSFETGENQAPARTAVPSPTLVTVGPVLPAATSTSAKNKIATSATRPHPVAPTLSLTVTPKNITQGDPVMITVAGTTTKANIAIGTVHVGGASAAGTPLLFSIYAGKPTAFYAAGINSRTGTSTVTVVVNDDGKNGPPLSATFFVKARVHPTESLPIPDQIGGNSPANQVHVEDVLGTENAEIDSVPSAKTAFWSGPFAYPLKASDENAVALKVTDPYGYNRDSGELTIPHMGTDFRAASGTPVYAVNDGLVRVTKTFVVYGGTVIVDHGTGIESFYMHLSRILAAPGDMVKKGQLIGYSGETGYAVGPHLHLTIKINGLSIDPLKFFALFNLPAVE